MKKRFLGLFCSVLIPVIMLSSCAGSDKETTKESGKGSTTGSTSAQGGSPSATSVNGLENSTTATAAGTSTTADILDEPTMTDSAGVTNTTANSSGTSTTANKKTNSATAIATTTTHSAGTTTTANTSVKPTTTTAPKQPSGGKRLLEEMAARYNADEKNGYSVWTFSNSQGRNTYCVDSKGYASFTFDKNEDSETQVYNQAVLTKIGDVYRLRRATDGKILFTTQSLPGAAIVFPQYSGDSMFKDGYVPILTKKETYNGTTYQLGFLNKTGGWSVPLSSDNAILKLIGKDASTNFLTKEVYYCGEGMMAFTYNDANYLYDITTNKTVRIQASGDMSEHDIERMIKCDLVFKNGYAVVGYSVSGWGRDHYCKIYKSGKTEDIPLNFHENLHESFGSSYYNAKNNTLYRMGYTYHQDCISVFDSKGNIVKRIDNVTLFSCNGFNEDGYAQLVFTNEEGSRFYTVIDINGNMLFEPIKMDVAAIFTPDGYVVACNSDYEWVDWEGSFAVVDNKGKILHKIASDEFFSCQNGIIAYKVNQQTKYLELKK